MKFSKISVFHTGLTLIAVFSSSAYSVPIALIPSKISPTAFRQLQETSFLREGGSNKVQHNLIQSSEENSFARQLDKDYERFDRSQSDHRQDSSNGGVRSHLAKFYRSGYSPSSSQPSEDTIIFPSTSSSFPSPTVSNDPEEAVMITTVPAENFPSELPQDDFTSLYGETVRTLRGGLDEPDHHRHPIVPAKSSHEPEEPSYGELLRLLTSLLAKLSEPAYSGVRQQLLQSSQTLSNAPTSPETEDIGNEEATTVAAASSSTSQEVGHYSLYSGPKIKDAPCPPGQSRTHAGHCQVKSRKLASSSG